MGVESKKQIFENLSKVNLKDKIKEKIGLKYLSWAHAWDVLKTMYPDSDLIVATRKIETEEERTIEEDGVEKTFRHKYEVEVPYFTDGKTCWVDVTVRIGEDTESEHFYPVTNNKNLSVSYNTITSTDVNKAIQRAFVKCCGRFGLGLYIYQGEDLPGAEKVVIDFKSISSNCDRFKLVPLDENGFNALKQTVIAQLTKYSAMDNQEILTYPAKILNGQRTSELVHGALGDEILQKLNYYFGELDKIFAAEK